MKKELLLCAGLLLATVTIAKPYDYEITPIVGYNIAEGNLGLKDQALIGGEFQLNNIGMPVSPELSILYANGDYKNSAAGTNLYRIALNGVYDYEKNSIFTPFVKAGLGYESMSTHQAGNLDSPFIDAGAGAKIAIIKHLALKLEAVYMLKNNNNRWDNNLALLAGVTFSFGDKRVPAPVVADDTMEKEQALALQKQQEEAKEQARALKKQQEEAAALAKANGDDDHDGVKNSLDQCPNTPKGAVVNANGCIKIVNLQVNFENASYVVNQASQQHVKSFAQFLKTAPMYNATIIGYTDSVGKKSDNLKLSLNRANAVKDLLVQEGVTDSRLSVVGKGEADPVATNSTKEGRAQNRRIVAKLTKIQ